MTADLLPCPFCGGEAGVGDIDEFRFRFIYCLHCGARTCGDDIIYKDLWNTRYESDELPEWAKHEINMHYIMAARESSEIIRELNKNSSVAVGDDSYFSGYLAALRWVLSLKKE